METECYNSEPVIKKAKIEIDIDATCKIKSESGETPVSGQTNPSLPTDGEPLPSVQMFGSEVLYRRWGSVILFKTASVLDLARKWLNLASDVEQIKYNSQVRSAEGLQSPLISWGSFKHILQGFLYDVALGDLLSHYRPFGKIQNRTGEDEICSLNGVLKLGNHGIEFHVNQGKVFLCLEDVALVCEEREEEMLKLKDFLVENQLPPKDMFMKVDKGYDENRVLLEIVEKLLPNSKLGDVLSHLSKQISDVKDKRNHLEMEIEQTVQMINRQNITQQACISDVSENIMKKKQEAPVLKRTYKECSNTQCGRTYHFILSCCNKDHVFTLGNQRIPYMYHHGKIYFEKCSAFEAIGKTSIIRCSNYRKVDKILKDHGLSPADEFLQQDTFNRARPRRGRRTSGTTSRNRRNHISLVALTTLVRMNFVSTNNQTDLLQRLLQFEEVSAVPDCQYRTEFSSQSNSDDDDKDFKMKTEDESSSGVESEDEVMMEAEAPSPECIEDKEDSLKPMERKQPMSKTLNILNMEVPYKVLNGMIFLKKSFVFKLVLLKGPPRKMNDALEKLIVDAEFPLEKAFLYEGRLSNYVSTKAIRCVITSNLLTDPEICKDLLLSELDRIDANIENLTAIRYLHLKTMGIIKYQMQEDTVYFDTLKLMRLADIHMTLVKNSPSKANSFVKKLLQDRGVNVSRCFLKQRNSKYAFINLRSALILLQYAHETEHKEKAYRLKKELLWSVNNKNILRKSCDGSSKVSHNVLKISNDLPNLRYKIKSGMMYIHRKTIFDCIGLETVIYGSKKGFLPINSIITDQGFDFSQVYLSNQQEVFAYISASATILLLESLDPIIVMLGKRQDFLLNLLLAIEFSVCNVLGEKGSILVENQKVPWITYNGRIFFDRDVVFSASRLSTLSDWADTLLKSVAQAEQMVDLRDFVAEKGLDLDKDFVRKGSDMTGYIGLHAILALFAQECDSTRLRDAHSLLLRDTLSAISMEEPKLRCHIRMSHFRLSLVNRIISDYLRSLQETGAAVEIDTEQEESGLELDNTSDDDATLSRQGRDGSSGASSPDNVLEEANGSEEFADGRYEKIRFDLVNLAGCIVGGNIGDWELVKIDPVTHLSVRAGYGASRKLSFLQPDVAAILRYDLFITRDSFYLTINDRRISDAVIQSIVNTSSLEGGLSLLYQLISLRPCFGSFSPELVETVGQIVEKNSDDVHQFIVDSNFIGTSSHGRTYAGTVRSAECTYVAQSRVADRCVACNSVDSLVINRSLLSGEAGVVLANSNRCTEENVTATSKPSHQSVWKLDTTDEQGCSFLCPQVQTFNCSLPHAFVGTAQATTVVDHRVEISDTLDVKVELCGKPVDREFPEFEKDHQLGPLLDAVAGLRICIGYPASRIVNQARFLLNHQGRMIPEIRKLFRHFTVDEDLTFRSGDHEFHGTIRSASCETEAESGSDICSSCRSLQQPLEFQ